MSDRAGVLMLPGLAAGDGSTAALRAALRAQGHTVHRWNLGRNRPTPELTAALRTRFFDLAERYDGPLGLVGWSLGGLYAHRLAAFAPNHVRCVITLGSPLNDGATLPSLPVPATSIYTRGDTIVPWRRSLVDDSEPRHENVEVRGNHFTLGFDPAVAVAIGDRLRCDPHEWKPFRSPRLMAPAYPTRPSVG